ncbi:MAG: hypothetical protein AAB401_01680 [Acidobacteriota bacterium]
MELICKIAVVTLFVPFFLAATLPYNESDEVPIGLWGGKRAGLEVTKNGGSIEFDCAHLTFEGKLRPDRQGRFSVTGTYVEEHPGPVRQSDNASSYSVLLIGQIKGEKMKLSIKRSDNKKAIGTYSLTRGQEAFIVKCR